MKKPENHFLLFFILPNLLNAFSPGLVFFEKFCYFWHPFGEVCVNTTEK
ncbi:hypothetical protein C900_00027 [Fulvivirga imtechensis AK7]|uniref:Uncharacterized protein n=1 Tax=Fulvivirga imtechensis AK7 TaxID=1237149 RepID=L8K0D9_9BACT|nr:hypothetical protein C900_00027 [Fulvivirga imtechensis AK7]